ncbi:MAG: hypothetical protein AAGE52_09500 [Myxococcota bacterium]
MSLRFVRARSRRTCQRRAATKGSAKKNTADAPRDKDADQDADAEPTEKRPSRHDTRAKEKEQPTHKDRKDGHDREEESPANRLLFQSMREV